MMDGAIAQPYYVSEYSAEKVPFDDAVALEDYLYKGTKALMEDTIFYVKKRQLFRKLTVNLLKENNRKHKNYCYSKIEGGHTYKYKVAQSNNANIRPNMFKRIY